ncbi:MAG: LLM class flavin-dependent oxidoreductase [Acidimicrobiales bacterium]
MIPLSEIPLPEIPLSKIPLSVLDLATVATGSTPADALHETLATARDAERLGYRRLWVAEHHAMVAVASSAPAVLVAELANATTTLRVGAGGVMLPNHAPLVVAEQFATLEALHPGRIDLGLGRAPGTDPITARALRRAADHGARFPDDVVELLNYLEPRDHPAHPAPTPGAGYRPEVWLLGSSTFSAQLAGTLGLPFSFAYHFAPALIDQALSLYRRTFAPSRFLATPYAMVAVSVLCAPTDDEARFLAGSAAHHALQRATGHPGTLPSPEEAAAHPLTPGEASLVADVTRGHVVGSPEVVHDGLAALVTRTGANELMVSTRAFALDARLRSLELVAATWGTTETS